MNALGLIFCHKLTKMFIIYNYRYVRHMWHQKCFPNYIKSLVDWTKAIFHWALGFDCLVVTSWSCHSSRSIPQKELLIQQKIYLLERRITTAITTLEQKYWMPQTATNGFLLLFLHILFYFSFWSVCQGPARVGFWSSRSEKWK